MIRTALRWLGTLGLGALAAAAVVWFLDDPFLGTAIGVCLAASTLLLCRARREFPDKLTGDTWADKRWTGLSNGVVIFAALFGTMAVPASNEYEYGLGVLVVLTGLVGYLAGSLAEMDRARTRQRDDGAEGGREGNPTDPASADD